MSTIQTMGYAARPCNLFQRFRIALNHQTALNPHARVKRHIHHKTPQTRDLSAEGAERPQMKAGELIKSSATAIRAYSTTDPSPSA